MKFFAGYVFSHIKKQIKKNFSQDILENKLLIVMPSIPPAATFHIGLQLEEYCIQREKLKLPVIKIANDLYTNWKSSDNADFQYYCEKIEKNDWNDTKGNLTSYRNFTNTENKLLVILLIGVDKITDSSSLVDFHHCDFNNIWDDLNHCFEPWIEKKFNESVMGYEEETVKNFDDILKAIVEKGLADILQVSEFLENLNLENAQDGKDAEQILLQNLEYFGLPLFIGYDFISSKSFESYIEDAIAFYSYTMFLEERSRKKAIKAIDNFIKEEHENINDLIPREFYNPFNNVIEFINAVREYVETGNNEISDKLKRCDFVSIHKLLRYKKAKDQNGDKDNKEKVIKISGNPIEAILTALWSTFSEYDVKGYKSIKEIQIKSELFKHDCSGNTAKEQHENAHEYISRLLGGVDFLVEKWILLEEDKIKVNCKLIHDQISYPSARSTEPFLKFSVTIIDENNEKTVQKIFAWRLPDDHPYRVSDEILQWAAQEIKEMQGYCLPVFNISYFDEIMLAKDEEEVHRVLMQCIEDEKNKLINLLDAPDISQQSAFLKPINKLAIEYNKFLQKAADKGIHSFFIDDFDDLRQAYEQTFDSFLNMDENNSLMNLLFRSFLIVQERKIFDVHGWEWEPYEKAGIVTILHPALLEMLRDQIFYLFECFNHLVSSGLKSSKHNKFRESLWQSYLDLAKIQTPICGLLRDKNMTLDTNMRGSNLVYRIGSIGKSEATLSTKLLLKYDDFDEEDISDAEIFKQTRESNTYLNILKDYRTLHPHANDALTIAVYQNRDIQPFISAINQYLKDISNDNEVLQRKHVLTITIFSESSDDSNVSRWVNQWKDYWETSEIQNSLSHYRNALISISHRIVDSKDNYEQFRKIINQDFEVDIIFLSNFISAGEKGNDFKKVEPYDIRKHTLKFPMLEKSFCGSNDPSRSLERARILSNRQFSLSTRFSELMARLKHTETSTAIFHVVLGFGDYSPWQGVIDDLHQHSEWVVCIDPSIDEPLIQKKSKDKNKSREIIGFGSGVGSHGENNYTVSTEQFNFSDILRSLNESIKEVYTCWEDPHKEIGKNILNETKDLSGLSLIKATGVSHYIRDFMAYALTRKLLRVDEDVLCNKLVSLDAYQHWFETAENKSRPDLLWIISRMDDTNKIHLEFRLIECKLAQISDGHINKAREQLQNGLQHLIPLFRPRHDDKNIEDDRPDQRYWWLQIHRLISSRTELKQHNMSKVLTALERLSEGDYSIQWQASAVTYWTDQKNSSIGITDKTRFAFEGKELDINSVAIGSDLVYSLCTSEVSEKMPWGEKSIKFDSAIQEEHIETDKEIKEIEKEEKPALSGVNKTKPSKKEEEQDQIERDAITDLESNTALEVDGKPQSIPERILLGEAIRGQKKVYWEYGHKELSNRHMIIFGTSGMGKTYAIQCLLWELGKAGNNSLIVDYTNGFFDNQLEPEIKTLLNPFQHIIQEDPLNINPFRRQIQNIAGKTILENTTSTSQRVSGVFSEVYNFGDQQKSALYQGIKLWLEFNKNKSMSLTDLIPQLRELQSQKGAIGSSASSVISKIQPFIDQNPFGAEDKESWDKIYNDIKNNCHIVQLAGFLKTSARLITEFVLIDLYWYYRWKGSQDNPKVLVLDEVQNLDHREESPLAQLLTEGRKFGFSLILATQIMSNLDKDEKDRLFNAAHKLFFKPVDTEIRKYAEIASVFTNEKIDLWVRRLADLKKGQCYSLGPSLNETTAELETKAFPIFVTSLEDRK
jgi:DNA phosphorothioation-dependent restriction protein DptH